MRWIGRLRIGRSRSCVGSGLTKLHIEDFVRAKRLKSLSDKTIRDEVHYIREALAELGWNLTPDGVREYLSSLAEDGEVYVLKHTTYSLKSFLKTVLKPRDPALFRALYDVFTVYKPKNNSKPKLPSIEQLRQVWQVLPTIEAKFYFALLAETGLRPGEPFSQFIQLELPTQDLLGCVLNLTP